MLSISNIRGDQNVSMHLMITIQKSGAQRLLVTCTITQLFRTIFFFDDGILQQTKYAETSRQPDPDR